MKRFALFASVSIAVVAGCLGQVDRVYDDAIPGGGGPDGQAPSEGGPEKPHSDASDDGAPPLTAPASIRGSVLGLAGTGLVLQNNGDDDLAINADGAFTFETTIPPGQPYKVTVANQPTGPSQSCVVTNGEGVAAGKDVEGIKVDCKTSTYPVGGTVVGLAAGSTVTLVNSGGNDVVVNANGPFTFPAVQSGKDFNVTIKSSSPGTTCNVSGGTGTVVAAAVDSVVVNCGSNTFTIGGSITNLAGTLVITNNGGNDRTITANGSFAFSLPIANGANYDVKVKTQPAYPPQTQACTITNGTGSVNGANVTNVAINCVTSKYTIGGTVNGLTGTGLRLHNNGGNDRPIDAPGGAFTFSNQINSGGSYNVTIAAQPTGQTCAVTNPSGVVASGAISNIVVNCSAPVALTQGFNGDNDFLPAGWTTVNLLGTPPPFGEGYAWEIDEDHFKSGPGAAYIENMDTPRDVALVSPAFVVGSATAKLTFWHHFYTENRWDGGVLEIRIGDAAWTDILDAGGSFTSGGYTGTLDDDDQSTLGGRKAWFGGPRNLETAVNLPASAAGKSIQLRWRWASDDTDSEDGWWVDDVVVTN